MKKLKLAALFMSFAMILTMVLPALAAESYSYEDEAQDLRKLGIFKGTSSGTPELDLGGKLLREQGVTLMVRLFGLEAEAQSLSDAEVNAALNDFKDRSEIPSWAKGYIALAVSRGIVKGYPDGNFGAGQTLKGKEYSKMLLEILGYKTRYETAEQDLVDLSKSPADTAFLLTKELIRDDVAGLIYQSLKIKGTDGKTLIDNLIQKEIITPELGVELAILEIKEVQSFSAISVRIGESPSLPRTVKVTFTDNTTRDLAITWSSVDTSKTGLVTVEGTIAGYSQKVSVTVYVTQPEDDDDDDDNSPPASTPIGSIISRIEATSKSTLKIILNNNVTLSSIDPSKIKFVEKASADSRISGLEASVHSTSPDSFILNLNQSLTENRMIDGDDFDETASNVKVYFDAGAMTLANGNVSEALSAIDAIEVRDKIAPTLNKVYVKSDSGANTNIIVMDFNEPVACGDAAEDIILADLDGILSFIPVTDYSVSSVDGNLEITVSQADAINIRVSVELIDGHAISDHSDNPPAAFGATPALKADGTPGGTITVNE